MRRRRKGAQKDVWKGDGVTGRALPRDLRVRETTREGVSLAASVGDDRIGPLLSGIQPSSRRGAGAFPARFAVPVGSGAFGAAGCSVAPNRHRCTAIHTQILGRGRRVPPLPATMGHAALSGRRFHTQLPHFPACGCCTQHTPAASQAARPEWLYCLPSWINQYMQHGQPCVKPHGVSVNAISGKDVQCAAA